MFCKSFHSCNRIYRKHFPSLLTEGEQKDLGCGAGEDEEKQPRELCMGLGKHHCRVASGILKRGCFWKILDI